MTIKCGDVLAIRKEWQDTGDENYRWVALDDESDGRVTVRLVCDDLTIMPTSVVEVDMVEVVKQ